MTASESPVFKRKSLELLREVHFKPSQKIVVLNKVQLSDFNVLTLVGQGGYGKVYQVEKKANKRIYALKVMKKDFLIKSNVVAHTIAEKEILRKIKHPFLIGLHYAFQTEGKLCLVMDFANGGQLFTHLRKEATLLEDQVRVYLAELVLALEHLHNANIIHRDLKPENILLDGSGHILLTDFGLAKENVDENNRTMSLCGTLEYMSPEMIKGEPYGQSTDLWSLGILLYDMLTGKPPFQSKGRKALQKKILTEKIKYPTFLTSNCVNLLKGLIERNVEKRLTLEAIKKHPFFKAMDWDLVLARDYDPPIRPQISNGLHDFSNFDIEYTSQDPMLSPGASLSASQDVHFSNFTWVRSGSHEWPIGVSHSGEHNTEHEHAEHDVPGDEKPVSALSLD